MQNEHPPTEKRKLSPLKMAAYAGIAVGAIVLVCVLVVLLFPDTLVNKFVRPRITKAFAEAYPAYSLRIAEMNYSVFKNRFGFDSVALSAVDGTFSSSIGPFSVSGIGWMHLLWGGSLAPNDFANSVVDARDIVLNYPHSHYGLRCARLHVSVADSEMTADSFKYHSLIDDERFFSTSQWRQTRLHFDLPHIKISGLDCLALTQGNIYKARSITIHDLFADILVDMDKPYDRNSSKPQMLNEALSSMKGTIKIDSMKIRNGRLKYRERFAVGADPGVVSFSKINVGVSGIANHTARPATTVIQGEGIFMNSATMKLFMAIPLTSKDFSLRCSGSLSTMDVTEINSFIEASEHRRITSGTLHSATFNIDVVSGQANGALQAAYEDLSISVLDKKTGSARGIFNRIASLFGKLFVVRGTNMPNDKGVMKIGEIKYTRDPEDYFVQYVWFALRNGIADVVGFPQKVQPNQ